MRSDGQLNMKAFTLLRFALCLFCVLSSSSSAAGLSSEALWSKGLAVLGNGEPEAAIELFDRAIAADPAEVRARFYRGLAYRMAGERERAVSDLRAVAEATGSRDPVVGRAALELAETLLDAGRAEEALPWLDKAQANATTRADAERLAAEAKQQAGGTLDEGAEARSRLSLSASSKLEYDSNVPLGPEDADLRGLYGIRNEQDGRVVLAASAGYALHHSAQADVVGSYTVEQSLHFDHSDSNIQRHQVALAAAMGHDRLSWGAAGSYSFYLLGDESFLSDVAFGPWVRIHQGRGADFALSYRLRRSYFHQAPFDSLSEGIIHSVGGLQSFELGDSGGRATAGYRFERRESAEAAGDAFAYNAHSASIGLLWMFPREFAADAAYVFRHADYDEASRGRDDDEHRVVFGVTKQLSPAWALRVAHESRFHDSSQASFEYRRHVTSLSLAVRY